MKLTLIIMMLLSINVATASAKLSVSNPLPFESALTEKVRPLGMTGVELFDKQSFAVKNNGKLLGVMLPGKGLLRADYPACFIGWSVNGKTVETALPTIGFDQWNGESCEEVIAVGVISPPDDAEVKIAVIYTGKTIVETAQVPVILAVDPKRNRLVIDYALTEKVNYALLNNIPEIRRYFASHYAVADTFNGKKYTARITSWCSEGNLTCDDVSLDSKSKRTGNSILLTGKTYNTDCPGMCNLRGYIFENKGYTYRFIDDEKRTLNIWKDGKVIDSDESEY